MCAGSRCAPSRAPPVPPVSCVKEGGRGGGVAASMTPVTEPLWVLERLPGEAGAPLLRLLLITPDWVKACTSQTLSPSDWQTRRDLDESQAFWESCLPFPRRAVFALVSYECTCAYICLHFFFRALTAAGTVFPAVPGDLQTALPGN